MTAIGMGITMDIGMVTMLPVIVTAIIIRIITAMFQLTDAMTIVSMQREITAATVITPL